MTKIVINCFQVLLPLALKETPRDCPPILNSVFTVFRKIPETARLLLKRVIPPLDRGLFSIMKIDLPRELRGCKSF